MNNNSNTFIENLEIFPIVIPLKKPMYMNDRKMFVAENVVVKITLSNGVEGWGEVPSAARMTGEIQDTIKIIIKKIISPLVLKKNISEIQTLIADINKSMYDNTGSKNAVNMALIDVYCKLYKIPFYSFLGSKKRDLFNSIMILGNKTWQENFDEAVFLNHQGTNRFKIKVAGDTIQDDIDGAIELRKLLGPTAKISADANCGLSFNDANKFIIKTNAVDLDFFEQPVYELSDMAKLQTLGVTKIGADEIISNQHAIKNLKHFNAASGVNLKLIKFSDPVTLVDSAILANKLGLNVNVSGKVAETGILTAALLHCASVIPTIDWGISTTTQYLESDILKNKFNNFSNIQVPTGHGLGIDVDPDLLKTFLVQ